MRSWMFVALWAVGACGAPGPSEEPQVLVLQPDGFAFSDEGAAIGAPEGALAGEAMVTVTHLDKPSVEVPLPGSIEPVGDVVRLESEELVDVPAGAPLLLGLPVPSGVDAERLAVAVLDVGGGVEATDAEEELDEEALLTWTLLDAFHDEEEGLLLAPVLQIDGRAFEARIVTGASLRSRPTTRGPQGADPTASQRVQVVEPGFEARCGSQFPTATETCGTADTNDAAAVLRTAFEDLTGLGFTKSPKLQRAVDTVQISQSGFGLRLTVIMGDYQMELRPASLQNAGGMYSSRTGTFWVATTGGGLTAGQRETVRHEYFHATQYGYGLDFGPGRTRWLRSRWSIEGQAVLSENSVPTLQREANRNPRNVDDTLYRSQWTGSAWGPAPASEYEAQDLWAYLAARTGETDLSFLVPFAEEGQEPEDVDAVLAQEYPTIGGLDELFWDWSRNQAFEKQIDIGGLVLGDACSFRADAADNLVTLVHADGVNTSADVTLAPMTSRVVAFELEAPADSGLFVEMRVQGAGVSTIRTKFYDELDQASPFCWTDAELPLLSAGLTAGEQRNFWVLVANTSLTQSRTVTVKADAAPRVTVLEPQASFRDGEDSLLQAVVYGFDDPSAEDIRWAYRRSGDNTEVDLGVVTSSGEGIDVALPCDDLLLLARVELPDGTRVSDGIAVSCLPQSDDVFLNATRTLGGVVRSDGTVFPGDVLDALAVGDDASNNGLNGFVHFSLAALPDGLAEITNAQLTLPFEYGGTWPQGHTAGELIVVHVDYGTLDSDDYRTEGGSTFLPGLARYTKLFSTETQDVTVAVQDAWDNRASRGDQVQFLLYFDPATDDDGQADFTDITYEDRYGTTLLPALRIDYDNY